MLSAGLSAPADDGPARLCRALRPPTMRKGWEKRMPKPSCHTCIYAHWDAGQWLASLSSGFPSRPLCANQPDAPGQLKPAPPAGVCRNHRPRPATPEGDIKSIPLGNSGLHVYVDAADYEWLSRYKWFATSGYAARREGGRTIFMHRQIMQPPPGMVVDHVDGNRGNNSRSNLRVCTRQENLRNQAKRAGCLSQYKGVSYDREHDNWFATIYYDNKSFHLGTFASEIEAARAYDRRAVEVFGPFARPNFPDEWPPDLRKKVHAQWLKAHGRQEGKNPKAKKTQKPRAEKRKPKSARATKHKARVTTPKAPARKGAKPAKARKTKPKTARPRATR